MAEHIYNPDDTICAIATAPGTGGIAVIRLCGPDAFAIADTVWKGKKLSQQTSHTAHLGEISDIDGTVLDQAVATVFKSPKSYTGDDTVEFSVHGSRWIQKRLLEILCARGARIALPGEYTRRAYASGHLDLVQAESVADIIASDSKASHRLAISNIRGKMSEHLENLRVQLLELSSLLELELDFSEEDVSFASRDRLLKLALEIQHSIKRLHQSFSIGSAIKNGFPIAIVGKVNAGKSSLLNAILDEERAIVSDIPGTTRDIVEDSRQIGDYMVRFLDTAGLRQTDDRIEQLGIARALDAADRASIIIYVYDASLPDATSHMPESLEKIDKERIIVVANKCDLAHRKAENAIALSAKTGAGVEQLIEEIAARLGNIAGDTDNVLITAARHAEALSDAAQSIETTVEALSNDIPADLVAQHLRETLYHLSTITGAITTPQILESIFSNFCIGK